MKKSYYEILEVNRDATAKEIKKSYANLLRKYPPEKFPNEFSEIAEAYETLIDSQKREVYSRTKGFSEVAQNLMDEAMSKYHDENYENAIKYFKKFILLEPNVNSAKNYLSICYARLDNYEAAYDIEKEVIESNENLLEIYFLNMFDYCENLKRYKDAEVYLLKALDKFDTFIINLNLVKLYSDNNYKNTDRAKNILINKVDLLFDIKECDVYDSLNLAYYSLALNCDELKSKYLGITMKYCNQNNFKDVIKELTTYLYIWISCWNFKDALDYSKLIQKILIKFNEKSLIGYYEQFDQFYIESNEFLKEDKAYSEILNYIFSKFQLNFINSNNYLDDIFDKDKEVLNEELIDYTKKLEKAAKSNPYAIGESISILRDKYPNIYSKFRYDLDRFCKVSQNQVEIYEKNKSATNKEETIVKEESTGCGRIILFMIIGAVIGGPAGAIIGALIAIFI